MERFSRSLRQSIDLAVERHPEIAADEHTCAGSPRINGTRIPVWCVLSELATSGSIEGVKTSYDITTEQIEAAIRFASLLLEDPYDDE